MSGVFKATVKMTMRTKMKNGGMGYTPTQPGKRVLKIMGECMAEGGTVSSRTWHDGEKCEWMEVVCDWNKDPIL